MRPDKEKVSFWDRYVLYPMWLVVVTTGISVASWTYNLYHNLALIFAILLWVGAGCCTMSLGNIPVGCELWVVAIIIAAATIVGAIIYISNFTDRRRKVQTNTANSIRDGTEVNVTDIERVAHFDTIYLIAIAIGVALTTLITLAIMGTFGGYAINKYLSAPGETAEMTFVVISGMVSAVTYFILDTFIIHSAADGTLKKKFIDPAQKVLLTTAKDQLVGKLVNEDGGIDYEKAQALVNSLLGTFRLFRK